MTFRFPLHLATCALTLVLATPTASAAPASPRIHTVAQPDSDPIRLKQWGDEWSHGFETEDGFTVVADAAGRWTYARRAPDGDLMASTHLVGVADPPAGLERHLRRVGAAGAFRDAMRASNSHEHGHGLVGAAGLVPPAGTANVPVVLANFADRTPLYGPDDFEDLLFASGNDSMKDFYEEISYGAFSVSSGPAGIIGWVTASGMHDDYGDYEGAVELVREAAALADPFVDFADYDSDGDCVVDVLAMVHEGGGEEATGVESDIWSHRWSLDSASYYGYGLGPYVTDDRAACGFIVVDDYIMQPETLYGGLSTIGVFAHEYGHALGLPDLYDTDYTSGGIGEWGLMAGGTWNGLVQSGDSPAHMSAWSKYQLGWVQPTAVDGVLTNEAIDAAAEVDDVYLLGDGAGEYFLVENRQRIGFDTALPGDGLAIWHIDEAMADTNNTQECVPGTPGCEDSHYRVSLEQADGDYGLENSYYDRGDDGDLYPGSTSNPSFAFGTEPSSALWDGTDSSASVTSIGPSAQQMTATFSFGVQPQAVAIRANGVPGALAVAPGQSVAVAIDIDGDAFAESGDLYLAIDTPSDSFWFAVGAGWQAGSGVTYTGAMPDLQDKVLIDTTNLPAGTTVFSIEVQADAEVFRDEVAVTVE